MTKHLPPLTTENVEPPAPDETASIITVLVADDHPVVREGIANMMRQQPDLRVVGEAIDGVEALHAWEQSRPDVTLLDLRLPRLDGLEVLTRIRKLDPKARVIILTIYDNDEDLFAAMRAGARGYLLKEATRAMLLDYVRRVASGELCLTDSLAKRLASRVAQPELTSREKEVLRLLGRGRTNKEIATALEVGPGTIKAHLKSIFGKLDALSRTEAIYIAHHRGLVDLDR